MKEDKPFVEKILISFIRIILYLFVFILVYYHLKCRWGNPSKADVIQLALFAGLIETVWQTLKQRKVSELQYEESVKLRENDVKPFVSMHVDLENENIKKGRFLLRNFGKGIAMNVNLKMVRDAKSQQVAKHRFVASDRIILPSVGDANKNDVNLVYENKDYYLMKNFEGYQFIIVAESVNKKESFYKYEVRKIEEKRSFIEFAGYTEDEAEANAW